MSERFDQLKSRHRELLARGEGQRRQMSIISQRIDGQLAGIDHTIDKVRALARNPLLIGAGITIIALLGPRRLWRLSGRGVMLYAAASRLLRLGKCK